MILPSPPFTHLRRLTDAGGVYEHAEGTSPRHEHGYCVDDVARALVVVSREAEQADLLDLYLSFVLGAQAQDGRFTNRRAVDLSWSGRPTVEDCWGRALWGLGAVVSGKADTHQRELALEAFERGACWWSPWSRSMAFAALGAAEVLEVLPDHRGARELLAAAAHKIGPPADVADWPWPEARLTYANAALPEVLLAAGAALGDASLLENGLQLLGWLLEIQTRDGHLSPVPVGGRGPADSSPGFDQQPIEVAALADGCARAYAVTGQARWLDGIELAAGWFFGSNDAGTSLYDVRSGGGCDGLERGGRNENQGAESTLALMSTLQHARLLRPTV